LSRIEPRLKKLERETKVEPSRSNKIITQDVNTTEASGFSAAARIDYLLIQTPAEGGSKGRRRRSVDGGFGPSPSPFDKNQKEKKQKGWKKAEQPSRGRGRTEPRRGGGARAGG
jgi:hypothetical protein